MLSVAAYFFYLNIWLIMDVEALPAFLSVIRCLPRIKQTLGRIIEVLLGFLQWNYVFYYLKELPRWFKRMHEVMLVILVLSEPIQAYRVFIFLSLTLFSFCFSHAVGLCQHLKESRSFLLHVALRCLGIPTLRPFNMHALNAPGFQK